MTKENNTTGLVLLTNANLKNFLYWWWHSIAKFRISKKKFVLLLTKDFFSEVFSCNFFNERVSCVKNAI